mgnify:CR=1 FL=1
MHLIYNYGICLRYKEYRNYFSREARWKAMKLLFLLSDMQFVHLLCYKIVSFHKNIEDYCAQFSVCSRQFWFELEMLYNVAYEYLVTAKHLVDWKFLSIWKFRKFSVCVNGIFILLVCSKELFVAWDRNTQRAFPRPTCLYSFDLSEFLFRRAISILNWGMSATFTYMHTCIKVLEFCIAVTLYILQKLPSLHKRRQFLKCVAETFASECIHFH